jgi:hypothetical protein
MSEPISADWNVFGNTLYLGEIGAPYIAFPGAMDDAQTIAQAHNDALAALRRHIGEQAEQINAAVAQIAALAEETGRLQTALRASQVLAAEVERYLGDPTISPLVLGSALTVYQLAITPPRTTTAEEAGRQAENAVTIAKRFGEFFGEKGDLGE